MENRDNIVENERIVFGKSIIEDKNKSLEQTNPIFYPPEEYDRDNFRCVQGTILIHKNYQIIMENLLDMLHVSFIHSFGSNVALPEKLKFEELSPFHGRSTFFYKPSQNSISTTYQNEEYQNSSASVIVENEYILPTNTVTRVFFGKNNKKVKTVFTRSIPVSEEKTILVWRVYRNFWVSPQNSIGIMDFIGDNLMKYLMKESYTRRCKYLKASSS